MGEIKTKQTDASVEEFINSVDNEKRREDGFVLLQLFNKVTGLKPKMWGPSIIGYGQYHYKSERSNQEGDWPLTGFSPRKQSLTLYVLPGFEKYKGLLSKLGKHKISVGCLYINKLEDVDMKVLEKIIEAGFKDMKKIHGIK